MTRLFFSLCLLLALPFSCGRPPLSGPPTLRAGHDECSQCGMIINEARFSSALLVELNGRREHLLYDDIGCMLDAERSGLEGRTAVERYVHDYETRGWIAAEPAIYLMSDPTTLPTPMGSGIIAFADRTRADAAQHAGDGRVLDWTQVSNARREWVEARREKPRTPPD